MAETHLVETPADQLPTAADWIAYELGLEVPHPEQVDVLYFDRFGDEPSAVVLLPQDMEGALEKALAAKHLKANREIDRSKRSDAPARLVGPARYPPPRVPRTDVARGEQTMAIESITCAEVSLRLSVARVSSWGINLGLLKREEQMTPDHRSFDDWRKLNGLSARNLSPDTHILLFAAYAVAVTGKLDTTRTFRAPRMPLIHNQRCGKRYILHFGPEQQGSPCARHILLYSGPERPVLYGVPPTGRTTTAELKEGLVLLQTWDKRIRFYQLTDAQWAEWNKARPDTTSLPPDLRELVKEAFAAAERLRAKMPPLA
jgi:hypothetical protein